MLCSLCVWSITSTYLSLTSSWHPSWRTVTIALFAILSPNLIWINISIPLRWLFIPLPYGQYNKLLYPTNIIGIIHNVTPRPFYKIMRTSCVERAGRSKIRTHTANNLGNICRWYRMAQSGITFRTLQKPGHPTDHKSISSPKCDTATLDINNATPSSYIE